MDFLKLVAGGMFARNMNPTNERLVQRCMRSALDQLELQEQNRETYLLRLEGHIELNRHMQIFGHLS